MCRRRRATIRWRFTRRPIAIISAATTISLWPGSISELSSNAEYWIGESLYSQKKYSEAIEQFNGVVNKYPKSDKAPGALLKKGYAYLALNDRPRAIVQFQYVVHEYPSSREAALAKDRLKQLGIDTK